MPLKESELAVIQKQGIFYCGFDIYSAQLSCYGFEAGPTLLMAI